LQAIVRAVRAGQPLPQGRHQPLLAELLRQA